MNAQLRTCLAWLALLLPAIQLQAGESSPRIFTPISVAQTGQDQEAIALAVDGGGCEWVLPAGGCPYYLVVGALGSPRQTFPVVIHSETTQAKANIPRETPRNDQARLQELARRAEHCRRLRQIAEVLPPRREPPPRKTFYIFTGQSDLENAGSYTSIAAELRKVGKYVQVYVDARDVPTPEFAGAVDDVIRTFDEEVYPYARRNLGQAADVNRDGRFTVLFSSWLSRLQGGKTSLDGFVRGSDFIDLAAPFGNRCDMLYLNSRLRAGPQLRTVLAHEYTHAVAFSEHVLQNPPDCRQPEETWLNESLAHLVEDLHQHGWSNLDHRVRAFLAQPHLYPLAAPDYFGTSLWRNPGTRGSGFLFLRWCHCRCGGDLPRRLIQSPFAGPTNLENAMQQPFATLFRDWGVSLIQDESWRKNITLPGAFPRSDAAASPVLFGPSFQTLTERGVQFSLAGTAMKFFALPATGSSNRRFRIQADQEARLQVTLIPLDAKRPLLNLHCQTASPKGVQVMAEALGGPVRLERLTWQKLPAEGRDSNGSLSLLDNDRGPNLEGGGTWTRSFNDLFTAPRTFDVLIGVVGKDSQGRTVVGWDPVMK